MFLSKVVLNPRCRETYRLLADLYAQHRFVMSAFPDRPQPAVKSPSPQREHGVLYRLETASEGNTAFLLVQSAEQPSWNKTADLHPNVICASDARPDNRTYSKGECLRFRLRGNPTICRVNRDAQGSRNPKREGLFKEPEQLDWLVRLADRSGFQVNPETILVTPHGKQDGIKPSPEQGGKAMRVTSLIVDFDGKLTVTDPEAFIQARCNGIGRGKAWGCGLLSTIRTL